MGNNILRAWLWSHLVLAGLLPVGAAADTADWSSHPLIGSLAPEFTLETTEGDVVSLRDLRGQFVVIHFGTSW